MASVFNKISYKDLEDGYIGTYRLGPTVYNEKTYFATLGAEEHQFLQTACINQNGFTTWALESTGDYANPPGSRNHILRYMTHYMFYPYHRPVYGTQGGQSSALVHLPLGEILKACQENDNYFEMRISNQIQFAIHYFPGYSLSSYISNEVMTFDLMLRDAIWENDTINPDGSGFQGYGEWYHVTGRDSNGANTYETFYIGDRNQWSIIQQYIGIAGRAEFVQPVVDFTDFYMMIAQQNVIRWGTQFVTREIMETVNVSVPFFLPATTKQRDNEPYTFNYACHPWIDPNWNIEIQEGYHAIAGTYILFGGIDTPESDYGMTVEKAMWGFQYYESILKTNNTDIDDPGEGRGGGGDNDFPPSDFMDPPVIPSLDPLDSAHFLTAYRLTATSMDKVGHFLWSDSFLDKLMNLFRNPMEAVISIKLMHFPANGVRVYDSDYFYIGNVITELPCQRLTKSYMEVDMGGFFIPKMYGDFLDLAPYTKAELFLPYKGWVDIDINEVYPQGYNSSGERHKGKIEVKYHVNILTGDALIEVILATALEDPITHKADLYKRSIFYDCNIAMDIPYSSADYARMYGKMIGDATTMAVSAATGNAVGFATATADAVTTPVTTPPATKMGGNLSGNTGIYGQQHCYFKMTYPVKLGANDYMNLNGYPSFINLNLGKIKGFAQVAYINLDNISGATSDEIEELSSLLKKGVYF